MNCKGSVFVSVDLVLQESEWLLIQGCCHLFILY